MSIVSKLLKRMGIRVDKGADSEESIQGVDSWANFFSAVRETFKWLYEHYGLLEVKKTKSHSFGNASIILKSEKISIEIAKDRDQILVYFGDPIQPGRWEEMSSLL